MLNIRIKCKDKNLISSLSRCIQNWFINRIQVRSQQQNKQNQINSSSDRIFIFLQMKHHYEKLNTHAIFINKKHHYRNIIQAKKSIDFKQIQQDLEHFTLPHPNYKYESFKDRQLKNNNHKILQKIQSIKNRSRVKTMPEPEDRNKIIQRYFPSKYLYKFEKKTYEDNIRLIERLGMIKPAIGTRQQWQNHFKKTKKLQNQIKRYSKDKYENEQKQLKEAITQITRRQLKKQGKKYSLISSQIISGLESNSKPKSKPTAQTKYSMDQNMQNQFIDLSLSKSHQKQQTRQSVNPKTQKSKKKRRNKFLKVGSNAKKNYSTHREGIYSILLKNEEDKQFGKASNRSRYEQVVLYEGQSFGAHSHEEKNNQQESKI